MKKIILGVAVILFGLGISSERLVYETTAEDINYMDQVLRNGSLRFRTGKSDKGGY